MALYVCRGCGCQRKLDGPPVTPPPTVHLYCPCCHAHGVPGPKGLPAGCQVFDLATRGAATPAKPVTDAPDGDEPDLAGSVDAPYAYEHPEDPADRRRWAFARYLFETGRIGEGGPRATQN